MSHTINVLIAGATGVGKSTLVNYLFNEQLRETGVGKPVTDRGFFTEKKQMDDTTIYLTDSWGVEADKVDAWTEDFLEYLQQHAIEAGPDHWLHTVIYCINAASSRVQPFDIQILQMLKEHFINPVVIFTKSHALDEDEEQQLQNVIQQTEGLQDIPTVFVNSTEVKNRKFTIETFGKENVFRAIQSQYMNQLDGRLRFYVEHQIDQLIENASQKFEEAIQKKSQLVRLFSGPVGSIQDGISVQEILKNLDQEISVFLNQTLKASEHVYNFFSNEKISKFIIAELIHIVSPVNYLLGRIQYLRYPISSTLTLQTIFLKEAEQMKLQALEHFDETYESFKQQNQT